MKDLRLKEKRAYVAPDVECERIEVANIFMNSGTGETSDLPLDDLWD